MILHTIDHTALFHTTTVAAGYPETVLGPCRSTRAIGRFPADTAFSLVLINAASLRMTLHAEDDVERDAVATVPAGSVVVWSAAERVGVAGTQSAVLFWVWLAFR